MRSSHTHKGYYNNALQWTVRPDPRGGFTWFVAKSGAGKSRTYPRTDFHGSNLPFYLTEVNLAIMTAIIACAWKLDREFINSLLYNE